MNRALLIGFCALISIAIGGGLWVVGSPKHARLLDQDADRLADLVSWQNRLQCLGRRDGLPDSLETAKPCPDTVAFDRAVSPFDAVTGVAYGYTRLSAQEFEVCATLALDPKKAQFLRADMELRTGNMVCLAGTSAPDT